MAEAKRKFNWFAVVITLATVVTVVAVGAIIVTQQNADPTASQSPTSQPIIDDVKVDAKAGSVSFGTGKHVVDTYVDFLCPYCQQFEATEGETLQKLVGQHKITLRIRPVSILDDRSAGTRYSSRAAGAFFAVADADPAHAYGYFALLYNNQPLENTPGLSDAQLLRLAQNAGVKLTPDLRDAILSRKYQGYARRLGLPHGAHATPTVLVDGKVVKLTFDAKKDILDRLK